MRVPLSWLREYVDLPATETGRDVQAKLVSAGLEVETVEQLGAGLKGPLAVGKVLTIEELEGFKKPIRFCTVDVGTANGTGEPQEIVCGARNFAVGDKVVVVLPGAVLPGDFAIAARKTYGRTSHGMICSGDELGMGDDGSGGIIVLPPEYEPGTDAIALLELVDEVLDIAVTPDRGYCLSLRGVAREAAIAYGLPLRDPALLDVPAPNAFGHSVKIADPMGCDRFTARTVTGLDPEAHSPIWLRRRLQKAGMRPISLAVDITNYVMLELGQPLHAYDRARLEGPIGVRRAHPGEKITTLDGAQRVLDAQDLVITDDRGPIGLAGVMGGANTEIADATADPETGAVHGTTEVVIEAAHFDAISIARTARRHKLPSEASKRFERGTDPQATAAAAQRTVDLLVLL
ncbi:phenylalanine--tRNA ligase subunit beta, partial [Streptomyces sp. NPDC087850]